MQHCKYNYTPKKIKFFFLKINSFLKDSDILLLPTKNSTQKSVDLITGTTTSNKRMKCVPLIIN